MPLLIVCCASGLSAADLVDFKLTDSALMLKVPREWALREGVNSFGVSFPKKNGFAPSFAGGVIDHSTMRQLLNVNAGGTGGVEGGAVVKEFVTSSGIKGSALSLLRPLPKDPNAPKSDAPPQRIVHTTYLFKLNELDAAMITFERLEKEDPHFVAAVEAVVKTLAVNPEFSIPIPGAVYKSVRGKFSMTPPAFLVLMPVNGGYRAGVEPGASSARGLRIERAKDERSLKVVVEQRAQYLKNEAPRASPPVTAPFKTDQGVEGLRFETHTVINEKETVFHVQYFFPKDGELVTLSCNYFDKNAVESRAAFDACAKSFKFE